MFKNSFRSSRSSRSSSWNKDLLLHVNPYKTLENVHTKVPLSTGLKNFIQIQGMPWTQMVTVIGNIF